MKCRTTKYVGFIKILYESFLKSFKNVGKHEKNSIFANIGGK
eukprot:UN08691